MTLSEILSPDNVRAMDASFKKAETDFAAILAEDDAAFARRRKRRIERNIKLFGNPDTNKETIR